MRFRSSPAWALLLLLAVPPAVPALAAERVDRKAIQKLARAFFEARPWTRFERWDPAVRQRLLAEAEALGPLPRTPEAFEEVLDVLWNEARKRAPKLGKGEMETPYGTARWLAAGRGRKGGGLLVGLHGGGEGAGDAAEAKGNWNASGMRGIYPQGIRLVHDTWNTVHGEAFVLTLIERAKLDDEIDPDRVYVAGFSMGGTGSLHLAGRYPDLFAGAIPAHGVVMASPNSRVQRAEDVELMQHGLLPNLRNVAVYLYTGLADQNCPPGTFLHAWDRLQELKEQDPTGYQDLRFQAVPELPHTFPPGEPQTGWAWIREKQRDTYPTKIVWEYAAWPFPLPDAEDEGKADRRPVEWSYWLHCRRPEDRMHVVAERAGTVFDLSVTIAFAEDFTIYLHPEMVPPGEEVVVRVDGKEVWRGVPERDLPTILESLDAKLDRRLTFDRRIRIPE